MKKKDYMVILAVVIFSSILSFIISGTLITPASDRSQTVETAAPISGEFTRPSADYFNQDAINPTQTIEIGDDSNDQPFDTE